MANFSKGRTWVTGEEYTPDKLHNTVDNANLNEIAESELASDYYLTRPSQPGTPTTGQLYLEEGRTRWHDGTNSVDDVSGIFLNNGAATLESGDIVMWDKTDTDSLKVLLCTSALEPVGVVEDDFINPSASGRIKMKGFAYVQCKNTTDSDAGFQDYVKISVDAGIGDVWDIGDEIYLRLGRLLTSIPANTALTVTAEVRIF